MTEGMPSAALPGETVTSLTPIRCPACQAGIRRSVESGPPLGVAMA